MESRAVLYVDIPTSADFLALTSHQGEACVSIYLRTTPITQKTMGDRIELKNLAKKAVHQLHMAGVDKRAVAAVAEQLDDLVDDDEFWRFQANSLAIFVTPENTQTFRVPNAFKSMVAVSNQFHVKPAVPNGQLFSNLLRTSFSTTVSASGRGFARSSNGTGCNRVLAEGRR